MRYAVGRICRSACRRLLKREKRNRDTYLVVCYGEKSYSGYSVRVEQCWKDKEQLYLETQLIGPAAGEEVVETLTYPFLVVRCGRTELLCRIES